MIRLSARHLLTGEELDQSDILALIDYAAALKRDRTQGRLEPLLRGKHLALIFEKPSLRTRMSFTVAMHDLGGHVVESTASNTKKEEPEDLVRVIAGYCHGVMVRTHGHEQLERMIAKSPIPVINGLSDSHHPCQILSDLLTLSEIFKSLKGLELAYVGDGNNILHSLLLLAPYLGIHLRYACPQGFGPNALILKKAKVRMKEGGGSITALDSPDKAARGANAVYTDVWTSMGFEAEKDDREQAFAGYCVDEKLMSLAAPGAIALHCLPMLRGKEISETLPESPFSALFRQSENRLHMQKGLLVGLLGK